MALFNRKPPWYASGLAFECTVCGRCCAGPEEGYVWITPEEIRTAAVHLDMDEQQFRQQYVRKVGRRFSLTEMPKTRDCVFLEETETGRGCSIYSVRPSQCRTWPFWPGNLANSQNWQLAGLRCPGINRGRLHDWDEIETQRDAT